MLVSFNLSGIDIHLPLPSDSRSSGSPIDFCQAVSRCCSCADSGVLGCAVQVARLAQILFQVVKLIQEVGGGMTAPWLYGFRCR